MYICDYRLDKSAHLFYKIHRNRYPVCTKPYAFDHFPKKLTPKRDFSVSLPPPAPPPLAPAHAARTVSKPPAPFLPSAVSRGVVDFRVAARLSSSLLPRVFAVSALAPPL